MASDNEPSNGASSSSSSSSDGPRQETPTSEVELTRLETIRATLRCFGFTNDVIKMVELGWGQNKQANSHWKLYSEWCRGNGLDPYEENRTNLLNFSCTRPGFKKQTYDGYFRTVERMWEIKKFDPKRPAVLLERLFLRGTQIKNPTVPRYNEVFDIKLLMKYIQEKLIPSKRPSDVRDRCILLFRTLVLMRSSEVRLIDINEIDFEAGTFKWLGSKTEVGMFLSPEVSFPATFQGFDLMTLVKEWMDERKNSNCGFLFNGLTKDTYHSVLGGDRIRNICKFHMEAAGIDITKYKPHSIRHASASALISAGATLDQVMALGRWQSLTTFFKYYLKQRSTPNVTELLLSEGSQNSRNTRNSEDAETNDEVLAALQSRNIRNSTIYSGRGRPRRTDGNFVRKNRYL